MLVTQKGENKTKERGRNKKGSHTRHIIQLNPNRHTSDRSITTSTIPGSIEPKANILEPFNFFLS